MPKINGEVKKHGISFGVWSLATWIPIVGLWMTADTKGWMPVNEKSLKAFAASFEEKVLTEDDLDSLREDILFETRRNESEIKKVSDLQTQYNAMTQSIVSHIETLEERIENHVFKTGHEGMEQRTNGLDRRIQRLENSRSNHDHR